MTTTVATVRRWGSSCAVILPASLVKELHLKEGHEVVLDVHKPSSHFGLLRKYGAPRMDAQAVKDELRKEYAARERKLERAFAKRRGAP